MSIFKTTDEQKVNVYKIATKMSEAGLPSKFVSACVAQALEYEGTHDLMVIWAEADNQDDKNEVLADLQEELDSRTELPKEPLKKPYIKFDDLGQIAMDVMAFKKQLRIEVDKRGGISHLAEKTGIPQPSLSRFFNTASMPRRTTLYKIAEALNLDEGKIVSDWVV